MLDNVIDITECEVERVQTMMKNVRRIGLGIMGFAQLLFLLKIGYDTEKGRNLGLNIMKTLTRVAQTTSIRLGMSKGPFPFLDKSDFTLCRRNCATTTVAPTGTTAMLADTSGGLEPEFALAYKYRGVLGSIDNGPVYNVNPIVEDYLRNLFEVKHVISSESQLKEILSALGKSGGFKKMIASDKSKWGFLSKHVSHVVTAMEISPIAHVLMQAAFQKHCDNSISKTINLPHEATALDIEGVIILAWQKRCKGCTVYRDGSRKLQVLNVGTTSSDDNDASVSNNNNKSDEEEGDNNMGLTIVEDSMPCILDIGAEHPSLTLTPGSKKRIRKSYIAAAELSRDNLMCRDCNILLIHFYRTIRRS